MNGQRSTAKSGKVIWEISGNTARMDGKMSSDQQCLGLQAIRHPYGGMPRMRGIMVICLAGLGILALFAPGQAATLSVAIIDYQDTWTDTKGLGDLLNDLGQSYTDITNSVLAANPISLTGFNTFIIGGFCTQNATIRTALTNAGTTMHQFVDGGGTVIMLTQADQNRAQEDWIELPAVVTRGDPDFDLVYRVQAAHQIFAKPYSIDDVDLQGWQYVGPGSTWPTSWESFTTFSAVGVLAGDAPAMVSLGSIIEMGWSTGRVLFLSLAPDKARNIGNAKAKAQAPILMRNLQQYAQDVQDGLVQPIVIYQGGPYTGPITGRVFNDLDGDKAWDPGEPGIAGVGVSDTIDLVVTGADGTYTLPNPGHNASLLYICPPSGYSKSVTWHRTIGASSVPADFNFALTASDESAPFDFAQITDIHIGGNGTKALLIDALARIGALTNPPKVIVATGDLTNSGDSTSQYDDYVAGIGTSMIPVFSVFGNHDASSGNTSNFRKYLGPDYYSFNYGDCHFLILNSIYPSTTQDNWVASDLALLRGSKKLFIFQHFSPTNGEYTEFTGYNTRAVFSGHWHSQHTVPVGTMTSYNTDNLLFGGIDCSPAGFRWSAWRATP